MQLASAFFYSKAIGWSPRNAHLYTRNSTKRHKYATILRRRGKLECFDINRETWLDLNEGSFCSILLMVPAHLIPFFSTVLDSDTGVGKLGHFVLSS